LQGGIIPIRSVGRSLGGGLKEKTWKGSKGVKIHLKSSHERKDPGGVLGEWLEGMQGEPGRCCQKGESPLRRKKEVNI